MLISVSLEKSQHIGSVITVNIKKSVILLPIEESMNNEFHSIGKKFLSISHKAAKPRANIPAAAFLFKLKYSSIFFSQNHSLPL
jgi:hypothetical protein